MKLALVNRKGGVGKTTSAVFFAALLGQTGRTLLVDADPDQSTLQWLTVAEDMPGVDVVALPTTQVHRQVAGLASAYEHVVIDTPPGTGSQSIVRSALHAVDTVVIPTGPVIGDLGRLRSTVDFVAEVSEHHDLVYALLLTRVRRGTTSAREARPLLTDLGHPVLDAEIPLREAIGSSWGTPRPSDDAYAAALAELTGGSQEEQL